MHIAFFDSGLGGLSVAQELFSHPQVRNLRIQQFSYIADTDGYPYGDKHDTWLNQRILKVVLESHQKLAPDMWVIACNTASTLVLDALRQHISIPVVGVVPAIKPAAFASTTKVIGVLATPATVTRNYTAQLIADHAPGCKVILHGCNNLVHESEKQLFGGGVDQSVLKKALANLLQQPYGDAIDTVVLGCTHYPLIKAELHTLAPHITHWVDSGEAIARRVISLTQHHHSTDFSENMTNEVTTFLGINWCVTGEQTGRKVLAMAPKLTQWLLMNAPEYNEQTLQTRLKNWVFTI